jgi:hypothetical protein
MLERYDCFDEEVKLKDVEFCKWDDVLKALENAFNAGWDVYRENHGNPHGDTERQEDFKQWLKDYLKEPSK